MFRFVLIFLAAFLLFPGFSPPMSPTMTPEEVAAFFQENVTAIRGVVIFGNLIGATLVPLFAMIAVQMLRVVKQWAGVQLWSDEEREAASSPPDFDRCLQRLCIPIAADAVTQLCQRYPAAVPAWDAALQHLITNLQQYHHVLPSLQADNMCMRLAQVLLPVSPHRAFQLFYCMSAASPSIVQQLLMSQIPFWQRDGNVPLLDRCHVIAS